MVTFKTNEATAQDSGLVRNRVQSNVANGDIRYTEFTYVFTGTEAATGDTIAIGDLPVGATALPEKSLVAFEASMGGSALALPKIGDASDDDRYSATSITVNSSTAGIVGVTANVAASVVPRHVVTEATKRLIATFTRTNAATAGKKLIFSIAYRMA